MYDAAFEADAVALLTEWKEFRIPSWSVLQRTMRRCVLVDGRNVYERAEIEKEGFLYTGIGK